MTATSSPAGIAFLLMLGLHIAAGCLSLMAGFAAMIARKRREGMHGQAGSWYVRGMAAMTLSAAALLQWEPDRLSLGSAMLSLYLVLSGLRTARATAQWGARQDWATTAIGIAAFAMLADGGWRAAQAADSTFQGAPSLGYAAFAAMAALSVLLDLSLLLRRPLTRQARIARHLWRMLFSYFLAATALFLGQQDDVFPFMAGSPVLLLPSLLTMAFMVWWLAKPMFRRFQRAAAANAAFNPDQKGLS